MTHVPVRETLNGALMRRHNVARLLDAVRRHGPVSRATLVRHSKLSAPTVSTLVDYLLGRGLLREAGIGQSSGGRRPLLIEFNADYGAVAAVDLGSTTTRLALADLAGTILVRRQFATPRKSRQAVLDAIVRGIRALGDERAAAGRTLLAIGIGAPGMTDVDRGVVIDAANLRGWVDVPLRDLLQEAFSVPVVVDNDVNMAALGEYWAGCAQGLRHFVFIALGAGVGAGIVIDGRLHRGARWYAGEISHMVLDHRRWNEDFSAQGYLESQVGAGAIAAVGDRVFGDAGRGSRHAAPDDGPERLFRAAQAGHPAARRAVEELAVQLGTAVANVVTVLDPSLVVFGGGISRAGDALLGPVRTVAQRILPSCPEFRVSALADAQLHGALYSVLRLAEQRLYDAC